VKIMVNLSLCLKRMYGVNVKFPLLKASFMGKLFLLQQYVWDKVKSPVLKHCLWEKVKIMVNLSLCLNPIYGELVPVLQQYVWGKANPLCLSNACGEKFKVMTNLSLCLKSTYRVKVKYFRNRVIS
jgi:hypothetical protein